MDQEIKKWREKDPEGVRESLANPNDLELIEKGLKGMPGDVPHFLVQTLPDVIQSHQQTLQSLLLVRSATQPYLSCHNLQAQQIPTQAAQAAWVSPYGESCRSPTILSRSPVASTPPRAQSNQEFSASSPHMISSPANFSTPVNHRPITVQQPHQQRDHA